MSDNRCIPIHDLVLDQESKDALQRIKKKTSLAETIGTLVSLGVMHSIFTRSNVPQAAINITNTDFNLFAEAIGSLDTIEKAVIEKEIDLMIVSYQLGQYDHKHVSFWKNLKNGCQ